MRKPEILDLHNFLLTEVTDGQYSSVGGPLAGTPVHCDGDELDISRISGTVSGLYAARFAEFDDVVGKDIEGTLFFYGEDEFDYALNMAECLDLFHERVLRTLLNPENKREHVLMILGFLLIFDTEEDVWNELKFLQKQGILP